MIATYVSVMDLRRTTSPRYLPQLTQNTPTSPASFIRQPDSVERHCRHVQTIIFPEGVASTPRPIDFYRGVFRFDDILLGAAISFAMGFSQFKGFCDTYDYKNVGAILF
jgi:hypothetical protein